MHSWFCFFHWFLLSNYVCTFYAFFVLQVSKKFYNLQYRCFFVFLSSQDVYFFYCLRNFLLKRFFRWLFAYFFRISLMNELKKFEWKYRLFIFFQWTEALFCYRTSPLVSYKWNIHWWQRIFGKDIGKNSVAKKHVFNTFERFRLNFIDFGYFWKFDAIIPQKKIFQKMKNSLKH